MTSFIDDKDVVLNKVDDLERIKRNAYVKVRRITSKLEDLEKIEDNLLRILSDNYLSTPNRIHHKRELDDIMEERLKTQNLLVMAESDLKKADEELEKAKRLAFEKQKSETMYRQAIQKLIVSDLNNPEVVESDKKNLPTYVKIFKDLSNSNNKTKDNNKEKLIDKTITTYFEIKHNKPLKDLYKDILEKQSEDTNSKSPVWDDINAKHIFSQNLRHYIHKSGRSLSQISEETGISKSTLNDWFHGSNFPRPSKIEFLANYFNIDVSDLTGEKPKNRIPVLGRIPAGIPIEAIEDILDYEEISPKLLTGGKQFFALKLKGDSMAPKYEERRHYHI